MSEYKRLNIKEVIITWIDDKTCIADYYEDGKLYSGRLELTEK